MNRSLIATAVASLIALGTSAALADTGTADTSTTATTTAAAAASTLQTAPATTVAAAPATQIGRARHAARIPGTFALAGTDASRSADAQDQANSIRVMLPPLSGDGGG
jgi:hypothetical protein